MARCKALYDCEADNEDELSFKEGDVLLLVSKEEDEWWHGFIAGHPNKQGMFPATFVDMLPDWHQGKGGEGEREKTLVQSHIKPEPRGKESEEVERFV